MTGGDRMDGRRVLRVDRELQPGMYPVVAEGQRVNEARQFAPAFVLL